MANGSAESKNGPSSELRNHLEAANIRLNRGNVDQAWSSFRQAIQEFVTSGSSALPKDARDIYMSLYPELISAWLEKLDKELDTFEDYDGVLAELNQIALSRSRTSGESEDADPVQAEINSKIRDMIFSRDELVEKFQNLRTKAKNQSVGKKYQPKEIEEPAKKEKIEKEEKEPEDSVKAETIKGEDKSLKDRLEDRAEHPEIAVRLEELLDEIEEKLGDESFNPRDEYDGFSSIEDALSEYSTVFFDYVDRSTFSSDEFLFVTDLRRQIRKRISTVEKQLNQRKSEIDKKNLEEWEASDEITELEDQVSKVSTVDSDIKSQLEEIKKGNWTDKDEVNQLLDELNSLLGELIIEVSKLDESDPLFKQKQANLNKKKDALETEISQAVEGVKRKEELGVESTQKYQELLDLLAAAENRSNFLVNATQNEIQNSFENVLARFRVVDANNGFGSEEKKQEIKERIYFGFYKIYRRAMLRVLEKNENEDTKPDFKNFEEQYLSRMQNLLEEYGGIQLESLEEKEESTKKDSNDENNEAVGLENSSSELKTYVQDFESFRKEYIGRKFLVFSWQHMRGTILGAGVRNYPEDCDGETYPVVFMLDRLMNDGLRNPEMGTETNPVLEEDSQYSVRSFDKVENGRMERDHDKYDKTLTGEVYRTLDNWVLKRVKFHSSDGTELRPSRMHLIVDTLAEKITHYLQEKYKAKGIDPEKIRENDVLRAIRLWSITTMHFSARSDDSAEGSDTIYYRHKFHLYNAKYVLAGTESWQPLVTEMLFRVKDKNGEIINPLEYLWGDHPDMKDVRTTLQRVSWFLEQGYYHMLKVMKTKGYLSTDMTDKKVSRRREQGGLASYGFMTKPLIQLNEYGQALKWKEKKVERKNPATGKLEVTYQRVYVDQNGYEVPPEKAALSSELFTLQPLMASLFFRHDKDSERLVDNPKPEADRSSSKYDPREPDRVPAYRAGDAKRYPHVYRDGQIVSVGKPISFLDYQDEWGEVVYERLPWKDNATNIHSVVNSLGKNGGYFLNSYLKADDIGSKLENPTEVAAFKNNFKYVLPHLPGLGIDQAAGVTNEIIAGWKEYEEFATVMMNMLIVQLVFVNCILQSDPSKEKHWGMNDIQNYLNRLVATSQAIDSVSADVIFEALKAAGSIPIRLSDAGTKIQQGLRKRFAFD